MQNLLVLTTEPAGEKDNGKDQEKKAKAPAAVLQVTLQNTFTLYDIWGDSDDIRGDSAAVISRS